MKMTLAELRATIKSLKKDMAIKKDELYQNNYKVSHQTAEGAKIVITEDYAFGEELAKYREMNEKYIKYNSLLNKMNSTNNVSEDLLLANAIIKSKQLRILLNALEDYCKLKNYKTRKDGYNNATYYYDIKQVNFDMDAMIEERDTLRKELKQLDSLIDKTNTEIIVEVED